MSIETQPNTLQEQRPDAGYTEDDRQFAKEKLALINERMLGKSADYIADWALDNFEPDRSVLMSSGGLTALMALDVLSRASDSRGNPMVTVLHNDTGGLDDRVIEYVHQTLSEAFEYDVVRTGPDVATLDEIEDSQLWRTDENKYRQLTKYGPIDEAITKHEWQVVFSGVGKDQTQNRDELEIITFGSAGELRVNPNFYVTRDEVRKAQPQIRKSYGLGEHPLVADEAAREVVRFVDDVYFIGGEKTECGIHVARRLVTFPHFAFERLVKAELPTA